MNKPIKTAIVCDWLTELGGAERVIRAVHELYPDAPIYTSQYRPKRAVWFQDADVRTGWLNAFPVKLKRVIPFLRQLYFSHLDLSDYDVVISITGAEAKSVKTGPNTLHVSYMHAPTQYYWTLYDQYIENPGFGLLNPVARLGLKLLVKPLRKSDYAAAQRPDIVVANSSYIQDEIRTYYDRDSVVIWPNVDVRGIREAVDAMPSKEHKKDGFIIYGRQVSWKRMDLAVLAALETGEKLTVIGDGPEHERLVRLAGESEKIVFLPKYNGIQEIVGHIRASKAYIFPSLEPFGIGAVEALAAGTPVIGLKKGGAIDFISDSRNGVFFETQAVASLVRAIQSFSKLTFDELTVSQSADRFSEEQFKSQFALLVSEQLQKVEKQ